MLLLCVLKGFVSTFCGFLARSLSVRAGCPRSGEIAVECCGATGVLSTVARFSISKAGGVFLDVFFFCWVSTPGTKPRLVLVNMVERAADSGDRRELSSLELSLTLARAVICGGVFRVVSALKLVAFTFPLFLLFGQASADGEMTGTGLDLLLFLSEASTTFDLRDGVMALL